MVFEVRVFEHHVLVLENINIDIVSNYHIMIIRIVMVGPQEI